MPEELLRGLRVADMGAHRDGKRGHLPSLGKMYNYNISVRNVAQKRKKCCHKTGFTGSKYTQIAIVAGAALPRTPLGELTSLP